MTDLVFLFFLYKRKNETRHCNWIRIRIQAFGFDRFIRYLISLSIRLFIRWHQYWIRFVEGTCYFCKRFLPRILINILGFSWLSSDLYRDRCCYSGMITSSRTNVYVSASVARFFLSLSFISSSSSFFFSFFFFFIYKRMEGATKKVEKEREKKNEDTKWFLISHRSYLSVCVRKEKDYLQ